MRKNNKNKPIFIVIESLLVYVFTYGCLVAQHVNESLHLSVVSSVKAFRIEIHVTLVFSDPFVSAFNMQFQPNENPVLA